MGSVSGILEQPPVAAEASNGGALRVSVLRAVPDISWVVLHAQGLLSARRLPDGSKCLCWRHPAAVVVQSTLAPCSLLLICPAGH